MKPIKDPEHQEINGSRREHHLLRSFNWGANEQSSDYRDWGFIDSSERGFRIVLMEENDETD